MLGNRNFSTQIHWQYANLTIINTVKYTHRVNGFMLWEAHRGNAVDTDSQDGDEQMDKCDPVGKKRPREERKAISVSISWETGKNPPRKTESAVLPVIIHVLDLPFDKAVNSLAVRPVCEPTDHAEPVGPLLSGKQLLHRNHNPLSPLLMAADTHHFLF